MNFLPTQVNLPNLIESLPHQQRTLTKLRTEQTQTSLQKFRTLLRVNGGFWEWWFKWVHFFLIEVLHRKGGLAKRVSSIRRLLSSELFTDPSKSANLDWSFTSSTKDSYETKNWADSNFPYKNEELYSEQMEDFGSGGLNEFTFFDWSFTLKRRTGFACSPSRVRLARLEIYQFSS